MKEYAKTKKLFGHKYFIPVMVICYIAVIFLTMYKDYSLTGDKPNAALYFILLPLPVIVKALGVFGVSKLIKRSIFFLDAFKIIFFSQLIMQIYENLYIWICSRNGHNRSRLITTTSSKEYDICNT